jgi:hypothetical protein
LKCAESIEKPELRKCSLLFLQLALFADLKNRLFQELEQNEQRLQQKGVRLKHTRADLHLGGGSGSGDTSRRDAAEAG